MIVSFDVFCYNINTWWDALGTNSCLCPLAMVKLVLLYLISLKVAVSHNLSMMLSEDLEYIGFYWVLHKLELLKIIWISLGLPWMVWLSWLEYHPIHWRVMVSISSQGTSLGFGFGPSWGACERQVIDDSLSHKCFCPSCSPSLPFSVKSMSMSSGKDKK